MYQLIILIILVKDSYVKREEDGFILAPFKDPDGDILWITGKLNKPKASSGYTIFI